ncbi:MAG: CHAT domain-containing protein [Candidatus Parabeggiatoa sp.]|nr:CHAT domain-containing protein [Candidatus Parabeggiatoa sp.]
MHLAYHAEFSENRQKSFIQTDDEKLSFDELEKWVKKIKFRQSPVELLSLSACQTATGGNDEQAALGLSGITIKAGVRSALIII